MKTIIISALFLVLSSSSFPQDICNVIGWVYNSTTKNPIANANIIVRGTKLGTSSDSSGYFHMDLPSEYNYTIVFSSIGFKKQTRSVSSGKPKEIEYRIYLEEDNMELSEVTIEGERTFEDIRTTFFLDGVEFDRLGEADMEKALRYFCPDIVHPFEERMTDEKSDFTLYVNRRWKSTGFLDQVDPFSIKYIQVWKAIGLKDSPPWLKMDIAPNDMPLRVGDYVFNIVTK